MAAKYYAVRRGRQPGIYRNWPETQKQVSGYPHAIYKSFMTEAEAQDFMKVSGQSWPSIAPAVKKRAAAGKSKPATTPVKAEITVYTDGGSRNHGNVAGQHVHADDKAAWAYRIELTDTLVTDSGGEWGATNNRMEIMAFLKSLERLDQLGKNDAVILYVLDSQYVLNAITKGWLQGWKRRGWKRSAGPLVNAELWQAVDRVLPKFTHLNFNWTKGHATNDGNVFVDHLLNHTMDQMVPGKAAPTTTNTPATNKTHAPAQPTTPPKDQAPVDPAVAQKSIDAIHQMLKDQNLQ